jgi:uncharacterized protein (TIGR03435 family)
MSRRWFGAIAIGAVNALWLSAQPVPALAPAFEVASIRPHAGPLSRMMGLDISGPRITLEGYSVFLLVMEAYHLKGDYQISLGSIPHQENIREVMYDIAARAPGETAPTRGEVRRMLQTLLTDRFKLAIHRDSKEMPVYALVVEKNGPRLKGSAIDKECSVHVGFAKDGRNSELTFSGCTIDALVDHVWSSVGSDRPVVDRTGVSGKYDFRLIATPEYRSRTQSDPGDVSIFSAVKELGFRLEPQKAPVEVVVVDRVEEPTEN